MMNNIPQGGLIEQIQLEANAKLVEAVNSHGKRCQLIDNTGTIATDTLTELLQDLIKNQQFGINALSSTDGIIALDKPQLTHIQIDENLYRLLVLRYQAVIENF